MRLDKFLQVARLVKRRALAKELCDAGKVYLDGRAAKASSEVKVGSQITIDWGTRRTTWEVLSVPERQVPSSQAKLLYKLVGEASREEE